MWAIWLVLFGAGLVAGVSGTVTGVGSVFSYPALLAAGLPPTSANVTNTVALALGGAGGAWGSRPDLDGQAGTLRRLIPVVAVGSAGGAALLLTGPPGVFERVVPYLVGLASLAILLPRSRSGDAPGITGRWTTPAMLAVSVYNGYFAAAGGVLIAVVLVLAARADLKLAGAVRNVLVVIADVVAALGFALFGPVSWFDVPPLVVGLFLGSLVGPAVARRLPSTVLRVVVAVMGLGLAVWLAIR